MSGPEGLAHLHRLRALVDGVVIGVKTALQISPRLTVRLCSATTLRASSSTRAGGCPTMRLAYGGWCAADHRHRRKPPPRPGIEVLCALPAPDGRLDPAQVLEGLRNMGLGSLLIEGGGITITGFLEAGLLDRLQVSIAPLIIGSGPQGLTSLSPGGQAERCASPDTRVFGMGSDIVFDCAFGDQAARAILPLHAPQPLVTAAS